MHMTEKTKTVLTYLLLTMGLGIMVWLHFAYPPVY